MFSLAIFIIVHLALSYRQDGEDDSPDSSEEEHTVRVPAKNPRPSALKKSVLGQQAALHDGNASTAGVSLFEVCRDRPQAIAAAARDWCNRYKEGPRLRATAELLSFILHMAGSDEPLTLAQADLKVPLPLLLALQPR